MIISLTTKDFKKLGDTQIDFCFGSNAIVGENGAGKSTVLEAIKFALYGSSAIVGNKEILPTHGMKDCEVTLETDIFTIKRSLKNCSVHNPDGYILASGHSPCTDYVTERLGMDYKAFSVFTMSNQGETQALLTLGATELNRRVEEYAGVKVIDFIVAECGRDIAGMKSNLEFMERVDCDWIRERMCHLETKRNDNENHHKELADELDHQKQLLNSYNEDFAASSEHNKMIELSIKSLDFNSKEIELLEKERCELGIDLDNARAKFESVAPVSNTDLALAQTAKDEAEAQYLEAKTQHAFVQQCEADIAELTPLAKEEAESQGHLNALEPRRDELLSEMSRLEGEYTQNKKQVRTKRRELEEGVCSSCNRAFDNFDPEKVRSELVEAEASADSSNQAYRVAESEYSKVVSEIRGHKKKLGGYEESLLKAQRRLDEYKGSGSSDLEGLHQKAKDAATHYEQMTKQALEHNHLRESILRGSKSYDSIVNSIVAKQSESVEYRKWAEKTPIDLEEYKNNIAKQQAGVDVLYEQISTLISGGIQIDSELSILSKDLDQGVKANAKIQEIESKLVRLEKLRTILRDKRSDFMGGIWRNILASASNFLNTTTAGWLTSIGRDDKGNFVFSEGGSAPMPVIGCASGAQRGFLGVAIRIGLTQSLLGSSSLLMLDEPTESMNEERANQLAAGLLSIGGQTITITHRTNDTVTADQIIEI